MKQQRCVAKDVKTSPLHPRLRSELTTIRAMITIYCRAHHNQKKKLCPECEQLMKYAEKRIHHCPFQENKPTCGNCRVHCYKSVMRQKVRDVMRYSGPRMTYKHPLMAIRHLLDSKRVAPELPLKNKSKSKTS